MSPEPLDAARFRERALPRLRLLYADRARAVLDDLLRRMDAHPRRPPHGSGARYSQADVVLITYADSIRRAGEAPLRTLARFLEEQLAGAVNTVHFLPFCPSSSDGGFSVIDYKAVAPAHGSWDDIARIGAQHDLMMDLVLNHCSSESAWFQAFVRGEGTGHDFFHTLPADTDVSQVVRPRTHPLLQPFETARGTQHVWATFSRDQPDLDYGNPAVLLAMETKGLLIGEAAAPELVAWVTEQVGKAEGVDRLNEIRTLHRGPHDVLLAVSIDFKNNLTVGKVENAIYKLELAIKERFPEVKRLYIEVQNKRHHAEEVRKAAAARKRETE